MSNKWQGTPVPVGVMVEKVYLNTAMTIEEVNAVISNPDIPYDSEMPMCVILADETKEHSLIIGAKNGATMIADLLNNKYYFAYGADAANKFGFEGWDPEFNGVMEVNYVNVLPGEGVAGGMNDKLSSLISTTPFVKEEDKPKYDWLRELFINEAKAVLPKCTCNGGSSDDVTYEETENEAGGITVTIGSKGE